MPKNTSVSLGDHYTDFVATQLASGRYANASDVLRAGLRLLEEHEASLAALRSLLIEGETSGESPLSVIDIWEQVKREYQPPHG